MGRKRNLGATREQVAVHPYYDGNPEAPPESGKSTSSTSNAIPKQTIKIEVPSNFRVGGGVE